MLEGNSKNVQWQWVAAILASFFLTGILAWIIQATTQSAVLASQLATNTAEISAIKSTLLSQGNTVITRLDRIENRLEDHLNKVEPKRGR